MEESKIYSHIELQQEAAKLALSALDVLQDVAMNARSPIARVTAANAILDRAYGKPAQTASVTVKIPSHEELVIRAKQAIARLKEVESI